MTTMSTCNHLKCTCVFIKKQIFGHMLKVFLLVLYLLSCLIYSLFRTEYVGKSSHFGEMSENDLDDD